VYFPVLEDWQEKQFGTISRTLPYSFLFLISLSLDEVSASFPSFEKMPLAGVPGRRGHWRRRCGIRCGLPLSMRIVRSFPPSTEMTPLRRGCVRGRVMSAFLHLFPSSLSPPPFFFYFPSVLVTSSLSPPKKSRHLSHDTPLV